MAQNAALKTYISPEEYLERENVALEKSEYYKGEIFAMSGVIKPNQQKASVSFSADFFAVLRKSGYGVFTNGDHVEIRLVESIFTQPDIIVTCEKPEFSKEEQNKLLNPTLILEVLSEENGEFLRTVKFPEYRKIESLKEYALVNQKQPFVEAFFKTDSGDWMYSAASELQDSILLKSLNISLPLAEIYERVEFEEGR